jgi:hypothetical protein
MLTIHEPNAKRTNANQPMQAAYQRTTSRKRPRCKIHQGRIVYRGYSGTIFGRRAFSLAEHAGRNRHVRKLIGFDDDTFDKLKQLGRDRMATIQELADEAFTDLLRKHGIPVDLKDALRKSASLSNTETQKNARTSSSRMKKS